MKFTALFMTMILLVCFSGIVWAQSDSTKVKEVKVEKMETVEPEKKVADVKKETEEKVKAEAKTEESEKKAAKVAKKPAKEEKTEAKTEAKAEEPKEITTESGLKYVDLKIGEGASPKKGDNVFVHYVGTLVNGKKFDSSRDKGVPFNFPIGMGKVIKGWDEGVMTMKVGGIRKLIVPPKLGYGSRSIGSIIPANSTLLFEVELLEIK